MWELTSGIPAFNGRSYDFNLSLGICKGLRPKIIEGTFKKCRDSGSNKRTAVVELYQILYFLYNN
jgi:hypothetical protein